MFETAHLIPRRSRKASLLISTSIHAAAISGLLYSPQAQLPRREKSEYELAIQGKEEKLVWYRFQNLPDVSPPETSRSEPRPVRAEQPAKQQIVASRKDAPKRPQLVLADAPELKAPPVLESPNLLAMRVALPPKAFTAPPALIRPEAREPLMADAPALAPNASSPVDLPPVRTPRFVKNFVPPPERVPPRTADVAMPSEAPRFVEAKVVSAVPQISVKYAPKPFTPPAGAPEPSRSEVILTQPPPSEPASPEAENAVADVKLRYAPRPFAPPPAPEKPAVTADLLAAGTAPALAVLGVKPVDVPARMPTASVPAQFSAGPKVEKEGADSGNSGNGVTVPDLFVRGARDARPNLLAAVTAPPTSRESMREAMRVAKQDGSGIDQSEPLPFQSHAGPVKVSGPPDPRFNGRDVFMMAIQMPNLTSYSGSWLMWYADRLSRTPGRAPVAAPVPHRKVDPKYVAAAAADRVEGKVRLACVIDKNGDVSGVEIVSGLDGRLNASAVEALSKWLFYPATREGAPVDVDVLVEIPFRLAPQAQTPY